MDSAERPCNLVPDAARAVGTRSDLLRQENTLAPDVQLRAKRAGKAAAQGRSSPKERRQRQTRRLRMFGFKRRRYVLKFLAAKGDEFYLVRFNAPTGPGVWVWGVPTVERVPLVAGEGSGGFVSIAEGLSISQLTISSERYRPDRSLRTYH